MASSRQIKRRIGSAKNISKITKAMEMVSASKMRRAQQQVLASRPYTDKLSSSLAAVSQLTDPKMHPLLQKNDTGDPLLIVISTDRGLCGGLNTNLFKELFSYFENNNHTQVMVVGKKAEDFVSRMGWTIIASFSNLPEQLGFRDIIPITEIILDGYRQKSFSSVSILYNEFISTLSQKPRLLPLLPFSNLPQPEPAPVNLKSEYLFEPDAHAILDALLPAFIETLLFQLMLNAKASEHSARMIAMQNASNNATEVVESLQLEYNKSRQNSITTELIEITTASLSI